MSRRRLRERLRGEGGYSLIEMLTVLVIMGVVMGGLTTVFSGALKSEVDMNNRFQAQQTARLALDKIRREVHCAKTATPAGATTSITITLSWTRSDGTVFNCKTGSGSVTWCTRSVATGRYALYRVVGSACGTTGGVKWADYLTLGSVFNYTGQSTASLAKLAVDFPVNVQPSRSVDTYELRNDIVLRNSTRS